MFWTPDEIAPDQLLRLAPESGWFLGWSGAAPVATFCLMDDDPSVWPEAAPNEALYVHRLAVHPDWQGAGCPRPRSTSLWPRPGGAVGHSCGWTPAPTARSCSTCTPTLGSNPPACGPCATTLRRDSSWTFLPARCRPGFEHRRIQLGHALLSWWKRRRRQKFAGDFKRDNEVKVTVQNEIGRELAAWERLVAADREKNLVPNFANTYMYRLEAMSFRTAPLDRVALGKHLLSTLYYKDNSLLLLSEFNSQGLHTLTSNIIAYILESTPDAAHIFLMCTIILTNLENQEVNYILISEFKGYITNHHFVHESVSTSIQRAVKSLFAVGLLRDRGG